MKDGFEIRDYTILPVQVEKDIFQETAWVAHDGEGPYYLNEGTTLFFDRQEALKYVLDLVHYERKRLKKLEEKLLMQLLGEDNEDESA